MTHPLEKRQTATEVLMKAAMLEAPILIAGGLAYVFTENWIWLVAAVALGGLLWIPAVAKLKQIRELDDASR